jgi:hypothetical protein
VGGINKSGVTDKKMMIRGGHVGTHDGHLIIEEEAFRIADHIPPQQLAHPPAVITDTEPAIPEAPTVTAPLELRTYETTTFARHIRDLLFREGYIIHVWLTGCAGLAVYTALSAYWWWLSVQEAVWTTTLTYVKDILVVLALAGLGALGAKLLRRGGGSGPIDLKACPRGPLGPGRWRIWRD